jgi:hypothetical protein
MQQMNIRFATTMMVTIGGETKNIEVISEGGLIWISLNKIKEVLSGIDIPFDPSEDLLMPMKKRIVRMVMIDGDLDFQIDSESMIRWIEKINEKKEEKEEKEEEKKEEEENSSSTEGEGEETTE